MRTRKRLSHLMAWLLTACLLLPIGAARGLAQTAPEVPFWDVVGTEYEQAARWLYSLGVVRGVSPGQYGGEQKVTRAQMATFVVRVLGLESSGSSSTEAFTDVPNTHWAFSTIHQASAAGIVRGTGDGKFEPEREVTHAETIAMLIRALGYEWEVLGTYPTGYVIKANELGLLTGFPGFSVTRHATRGDVALMLSNAVFRVPLRGSETTLSQARFKVPASIQISPTNEVLPIGSTQLQAQGVDFAGKVFGVNATYRVVSGSAVVTSQGQLQVTGGGTVVVEAAVGDKAFLKTYKVADSLTLDPTNSSMELKGSVTLAATAVTRDGQKVAVEPRWQVVSGPGQITASGKLTATAAGVIEVSASYGDLEAKTQVYAGVSLAVSPAKVTLTPGGKQTFTATLAGSNQKITPVWKVASGSGVISEAGEFTAINGDAVIEASVGAMTSTAAVTLIKELVVTPTVLRVSKSGSVSMKVLGRTASGQEVEVSPTFSVTNNLGIVDAKGTFVATSAGVGEMVVKYSSLTSRIPLTVVGEAVGLRMSTSATSAPANGTTAITVRAWASDVSGNVVSGSVSSIRFALSSSLYGSLSALEAPVVDGVAEVTFKPSLQSGAVTIYASADSLPSTIATVNTYPPVPSRIQLRAYPDKIAADTLSLSTISAVLVDSDGVEITNGTGTPIVVNLANGGPAFGTLSSPTVTIPQGQSSASATFRSTTSLGTARITGAAPYPVTETSVATVLVGNAARVRINPDIKATKADNLAEMIVKVEIQDANGNIRTSDHSTFVTVEYGPDGAAKTTAYATASGGVATFRLKSTKAGEHRIRAWTSTLLGSDERMATFLPGNPTRLVLSTDPTNIVPADRVSSVNLVATITDAYNNPVPTASRQVTFSKVGGGNATTVPSNAVVSTENGVARLAVTGSAYPGTDTYTATAEGLTIIGTAGANITVTSVIIGVPTRVEIQPLPSPMVGETATVKVYLKDANGNLAINSSSRLVTLSSNSSTVSVSGPAMSSGGVTTFTVTTTKSQTVALTASSEGVTSDVGDLLVIKPGTPVKVVLKSSADALTADGTSQALISADLVDGYGNTLVNSERVELAISNPQAGRLLSTTLYTGGSTVALIANATPGTITITGSAGYPVESVTIQTAIAGAPARVRVLQPTSVTAGTSTPMQVRVRIEDAQGNVVTSLSTGIDLTAVGLTVQGKTGTTTIQVNGTDGLSVHNFNADGQITGASRVVNGVATFTFTNTKAETVNFVPVAYYKGSPLTPVAAIGTTVAGVAQRIEVSPTPVVFANSAGGTVTVLAKVVDANGNIIPTTGDTVRFALGSNSFSQLDSASSVTTNDGTATVVVRAQVSSTGGISNLTVSSDRSGVQPVTVQVVSDQTPAAPTVFVTDYNGADYVIGTAELGARIQITAPVRNLDQEVVVQVDGVIVTLYQVGLTSVASKTIPAGSNATLVGYIRKQDLGVAGVKQVRVSIVTSLGISPLSSPAQITNE